MFNLSPIPPTAARSRSMAPLPAPVRMVSPAPWVAASRHASMAQDRLAAAIRLLAPAPKPEPGMIGIPELTGPDSPDNPWFVSARPTQRAALLATEALTDIQRATGVGGLAPEVLSAFDGAARGAIAGVRELTAQNVRPADLTRVAHQLTEASLLLDRAKALLMTGSGWQVQLPHPSSTIQ